jgi:ESF2/ABP1 family protein
MQLLKDHKIAITMSSRKRNEFLDIEDSDAEQSDHGYDSEAAEESKTRASKRRKILDSDNRFANLEDDDDDNDNLDDDNENENDDDDGDAQEGKKKPVKPLVKPPKKNKTGVVYLSSLPPYLKPSGRFAGLIL